MVGGEWITEVHHEVGHPEFGLASEFLEQLLSFGICFGQRVFDGLADLDSGGVTPGIGCRGVHNVDLATPIIFGAASEPVPDVGMAASQRQTDLFARSADTDRWYDLGKWWCRSAIDREMGAGERWFVSVHMSLQICSNSSSSVNRTEGLGKS